MTKNEGWNCHNFSPLIAFVFKSRMNANIQKGLEQCPSNKVCLVLGHSFRMRLLSDTHLEVFATLKPPRLLSGETFGVIINITE